MDNLQNVTITIENIEQKDSEETSWGIILCATVCLVMFGLPFIISDLYYSYSYTDPCLSQSIPSLPTLGIWLAVNGWVNLGFLIVVIIVLIFFMKEKIDINNLTLYVNIITGCFGLAWLVIGSVLFWKYLQPNGSCSSSLSTYMWVRLIIGLLGLANVCRREKK
jgi:hypothetical protein